MSAEPLRRSDRIRPLDAMRAMRALLRNPDDTALVFEIIEALSGRTRARVFERLEHEHAAAAGDHEPIAPRIVGAGSRLRRGVACGG